MIIKTEFLSKLKDFGLNSYEAKIWSALLSRGVSTAGELSDIAAVPRSRSYDVLESLERKGFIITKLGKPFKYLAVSPNEVVERVKKNIKEEADKQANILDTLKDSDFFNELNVLHSKGIENIEPTELSGYIKSRNAIHSQMTNIINKANSNVIIACSNEELLEKQGLIEDSLKEAKKRNVEVKILLSNVSDLKSLSEIKKYAVIKHYPDSKNRFIIGDNKELLMMLQDSEGTHPAYDTGVWVNSEFFVNSLSNLFQNTWTNSKKL